jgi:hypothetical protein
LIKESMKYVDKSMKIFLGLEEKELRRVVTLEEKWNPKSWQGGWVKR